MGFFFRLMMMAVSAEVESFTSLGIKSDLGKVITCAPEVGEYTRVGRDMSTAV